jgi:hypothetical protein
MMNKNTILLICLLLLGGSTYWYWKYIKSDTSLTGGDWVFAVTDTASIAKIFLAERKNGQTITLERDGNGWLVSSQNLQQQNKKSIPRPDAVKNLLKAIHNVQLQYRLPRASVRPVVEDLASNSVKVELYNKLGKKIKCYYVGGGDQDGTATYMIMENSNEPYAMGMSSFVGTLRPYFFTTALDWRDRTVFAEKMENIKTISIEYPLQQSKSFKMTVNDGKNALIEPFYPMNPKIPRPVTTGLPELFLKGFQSQIAEGFESDYPQKDSVLATKPFAIITLHKTNGQHKTVRLFSTYARDRGGEVISDPIRGVQVERYFADVDNGTDFMTVQHVNFQEILWAYESFFFQKI